MAALLLASSTLAVKIRQPEDAEGGAEPAADAEAAPTGDEPAGEDADPAETTPTEPTAEEKGQVAEGEVEPPQEGDLEADKEIIEETKEAYQTDNSLQNMLTVKAADVMVFFQGVLGEEGDASVCEGDSWVPKAKQQMPFFYEGTDENEVNEALRELCMDFAKPKEAIEGV